MKLVRVEGLTVLGLVVLTILVSTISTLLHDPLMKMPVPLRYSDVVYGVFYDIFLTEGSKRWYIPDSYKNFINGRGACPKPYIDYFIEYPPLVGLIFYLTSCTALTIVLKSEENLSIDNLELAAHYHLILNSLIEGLALLTLVIYVYNLLKILRLSRFRAYLLLILPSTIIYLVFNWDIIAAAFYLGSIYYLRKDRHSLSAILLSLSVLTKVLPGILILIPLTMFLFRIKNSFFKGTHDIIKYISTFTLPIMTSLILLLVISPRALIDLIMYHSSWYCENCIYQLIITDVNNPLHRILSLIFILALSTISLMLYKDRLSRFSDYLRISMILMILVTSLNYVFTPQMFILLTPLALITLDLKQLIIYLITDVLNYLIIISFFNDLAIREFLRNSLHISVEVKFSPWTIDSLTQWIAILRNTLLLVIAISLIKERINYQRATPTYSHIPLGK